MEDDWRTSDKPIAVLFGCMDRRLNKTLDDRIRYYESLGHVVVVFRTPGGDMDALRSEVNEISETGRLKVVEGYPHRDCGWVRATADALHFHTKKTSDLVRYAITAQGRRVFRDMQVTDRMKENKEGLYASMEAYFLGYMTRSIKNMIGDDVMVQISMPNAKELDTEQRGEHHEHHLVFAVASGTTYEEMARVLGIRGDSMYVLQSSRENSDVIVPQAGIAHEFLGLNRMHFVGSEQNFAKVMARMEMIQQSPFGNEVVATSAKLEQRTRLKH